MKQEQDTEQISQTDVEIGKPLTHREEEIIHLVETTPNDMELGKIMRNYYREYLENLKSNI